ncbi:hypothetical protein NQK81_01830 [Amycolatopsis roodepoortensis]|uniref:hypothetical protein n=1 Tax=Amycolatopsis roodepoortensis TaxID=700274 RepID=UPI00214AFE4B|nr:hypothetical protein [Amycolatopsis roodepoortensis]UUV32214.1 hypothetical protein NQK81_01830 [Amycolatopsis roodepoortensis]
MTIGGARDELPSRNDRVSPARDEEQGAESSAPNATTVDRSDERRSLVRLAGRILGSWGATVRLVMILTVIIGGLWLLNAAVDLGPIRLGKP